MLNSPESEAGILSPSGRGTEYSEERVIPIAEPRAEAAESRDAGE
jgi:hypothetical protein